MFVTTGIFLTKDEISIVVAFKVGNGLRVGNEYPLVCIAKGVGAIWVLGDCLFDSKFSPRITPIMITSNIAIAKINIL